MNSKFAIIIFSVVSAVILMSAFFIYIMNTFFPRQDVPTIKEASIVAENWIRNFSTYYVDGEILKLQSQKEVGRGEYEFVFTYTSNNPDYGINQNRMEVKTLNAEVVSAVRNNIFDEIEEKYLEEKFTIQLYFVVAEPGEDNGDYSVQPVERVVSISVVDNIERIALEELIKGPTHEEKQTGYLSEVSSESRVVLFYIADNNLLLELSFDYATSVIAKEQITQTMTQFNSISAVEEPEKQSITIIAVTGVPEDFVFTKELKEGDKGDDVLYLQKVLNADPETRIQDEGEGSPGEEVSMFTPQTTEAVQRFQRKYFDEVLAPAGLILSTGVVDKFTQDKLNSILEESRIF